MKYDLTKLTNLWSYMIIGDDANGAVDLQFRSLVNAAAFVSMANVEEKTTLTFPDLVVGTFDQSVSITIADYTDAFMPLS